ncbi:MAG: hypothetical protein ACLQQ4_16655 [Bacteroidia bacterium]
MKSILLGLTIITVLSLSSCGGSSVKENALSADTAKTNTAPPAAQAAVNDDGWVLTDLSKITDQIPVSMKVPKGAKMEKNDAGGVTVHVNDFYVININSVASTAINEAIAMDKGSVVNDHMVYMNNKIITEEPNGMIYSFQEKPDPGSNTVYEPQAHFFYYLQKSNGSTIYSIFDGLENGHATVKGSMFSQDLANKTYAIVKASAKMN